jgi:hypothetical protein
VTGSHEGDASWVRAYALAAYGSPVQFTGAYATVTVVRNNDDSYTARIARRGGRTGTRIFPRGNEAAVAAECASIAAHGPDAPECRSGEGHRLCGHVAIASLPPPAWTATPGPPTDQPGTGQ